MRCEIIRNHEDEIRRFCVVNNLSYNKIITSTMSWGENNVFVLHNSHDPQREALGMMDDVPMPVTLEIYLENSKLRFKQTAITHKYLGEDDNATTAKKTKRVCPSVTRQKLAYA